MSDRNLPTWWPPSHSYEHGVETPVVVLCVQNPAYDGELV